MRNDLTLELAISGCFLIPVFADIAKSHYSDYYLAQMNIKLANGHERDAARHALWLFDELKRRRKRIACDETPEK